jgi:hypothetical protein
MSVCEISSTSVALGSLGRTIHLAALRVGKQLAIETSGWKVVVAMVAVASWWWHW